MTAEFDAALDAAFGARLCIPLREAHELVGVRTYRALLEDCRAGRITHIESKGFRYMTRDHVREWVAACTKEGSGLHQISQAASALEQARAFNARRSRPYSA